MAFWNTYASNLLSSQYLDGLSRAAQTDTSLPCAQTSTSPLEIDDITPKHTLNIRDVDGEGKEWVLTKSCAKVVIFNSRNLTLRLNTIPLTSTIELFGSANITLILDAESSSPALGTLQLDPTISNVRIRYSHSSLVGSIIRAPNRAQDAESKWTFGFLNLVLSVAAEDFELVDTQGRIHEPEDGAVIAADSEEGARMPAQWVVKRATDGASWQAEPLKRSGPTEYPLL